MRVRQWVTRPRARGRGIVVVLFGLAVGFAGEAPAVTIDSTPIGNPGNACDPQTRGCLGAVDYAYSIGTYEITNAQYAEFLNAKAASDTHGLYNTSMGSTADFGGITRAGVSGAYRYRAIAGRENIPVNYVSFYDALRFANWMNNGQGTGDTETGAYTLLGGTSTPSNGSAVTRNSGATIFLPSHDEWYKAAYYSPLITGYFDYPASSDMQTISAEPTATANRANCNSAVGDLTDRGSYTGSASPYGTFDQAGNVWEWNEAIVKGSLRGRSGGSFYHERADHFAASSTGGIGPTVESANVGFRVVRIASPARVSFSSLARSPRRTRRAAPGGCA